MARLGLLPLFESKEQLEIGFAKPLDFEEQSSYRGGLRRAGEVRRASPDARRLVHRGDQRDDGPQRPRRRSRKL